MNVSVLVTVHPQQIPETLHTIEGMIQAKDRHEVVRVLIFEYLEKHLRTAGQETVSLVRVRADVRNRLSFSDPDEDESIFKDVIDDMCINGTLQLIKGGLYRFNLQSGRLMSAR